MNESKPFIEYSNDINDIYKNIEEYNRNKNRKILLVCHDVIANMANNKKRNPITKLFIRGRKLTIYLIFVIQSNFAVSKHYRKWYALFYYENSEQMRTSTNCT